jgi:glutathione S-transferase
MTDLKPIKLWSHAAPNPQKVAILLHELNLPYDRINTPISEVKNPEYLAVNPNGRLPSIHDPNTGLTLWESGAIIEYLVDRYDPDHRLSFPPGSPEAYLAKQWLFFQVSGQGPYFGQYMWFKKFHSENVPSAVERYAKEFQRVNEVLEGVLEKKKDEDNGPWLVGGKCSFADLAFVPWQQVPAYTGDAEEVSLDGFPVVKEWMAKMQAREPVKAAMEEFS